MSVRDGVGHGTGRKRNVNYWPSRGGYGCWFEGILSGRPVDVLAELIGSSPQVIRRHYAHLLAAPDHLRKRLDGFR